MSLSERMKWLAARGCYPSVHRRGSMWRAHVNRYGNWWEDAMTPHLAMERAATAWIKAGCPMDGEATTTTQANTQKPGGE